MKESASTRQDRMIFSGCLGVLNRIEPCPCQWHVQLNSGIKKKKISLTLTMADLRLPSPDCGRGYN